MRPIIWLRERMTWRRFNAARAVGYAALTPVSYWRGWIYSVAFVAVLSLIALVESAVAGWRADVPTRGAV